jgi:hypothetical protein
MHNVSKIKRNRQIHVGVFLVLMALLGACVVPAYATRSHHYRHGHYYYRRAPVVVVPRLVVPFGPYWPPYAYPPVVVSPPPVYVQPPPVAAKPLPPPPQYWYYCDQLQGYYPYVQQCPGGWRQVLPTPPQ